MTREPSDGRRPLLQPRDTRRAQTSKTDGLLGKCEQAEASKATTSSGALVAHTVDWDIVGKHCKLVRFAYIWILPWPRR